MTDRLPLVEPVDVLTRLGEPGRGRPHVVLVIGRAVPRPPAVQSVAWLGRHLGAEMLVVAAVEYRPPRDELVEARVASTRRVVSSTTTLLRGEGVAAEGTVLVAREGQGGAVIEDFADEQESDLVAVTAQRPSWLWVFPGSGMAHHLTRAGRRPVLVIPDHRPSLEARLRSWLEKGWWTAATGRATVVNDLLSARPSGSTPWHL